MTTKRWIALGVLVVIGVGLLVAVVAVPWSDDAPDTERANYVETGIGAPTAVGCFPAGAAVCGALDMVGNVMEWLATPYEKPAQLDPQKDFTTRQGVLLTYNDYQDKVELLCCGARDWDFPFNWFVNLGLRVLWSLALIV